MNKSPFLETALTAVKEAEKIILKFYEKHITVQTKKDNSPVTQADKEAEEAIRRVISSAFPEHKFLGEEFGRSDSIADSDYVWIIDPIDGTKNFIRGIPIFGTQIGLMHKKEFVVGINSMPAMGALLYAEKGQGAYLHNKKITVSSTAQVSNAYISYGTMRYFEEVAKKEKLLSLVSQSYHARSFGDCWAFALVAEGKLDAVLEGKLNIWDIAASVPIIQEAGGRVSDLAGNPITLSTDSFLATNGVLHDEVVGMMK